jgi:hypothetical protein
VKVEGKENYHDFFGDLPKVVRKLILYLEGMLAMDYQSNLLKIKKNDKSSCFVK